MYVYRIVLVFQRDTTRYYTIISPTRRITNMQGVADRGQRASYRGNGLQLNVTRCSIRFWALETKIV